MRAVLGFLSRRRQFRAAVTPISCGVFLVLTLCWAAVVAEAHPGMRPPIEDPVVVAAPATAPAPPAETSVAPSPPDLRDAAPRATTTSTAWIWVVLLTLPAAVVIPRPRWRRALVLTLVLLLAILACESAIHSVHHLKDPRHAEVCPVFSASQHVTGLMASTATPDLSPPPAASYRLSTHPVQILSRALDGEQSRAPPARLA